MRSSLVCMVAVLVAAGASASEREGPWRQLKRHAAGKGAAGEQLTVVEFEATPKGSMDDGEGCDGLLHRFVLEAKRPDGTVKKTVLVGEACNACWDHGIPVDLGSYGVGRNRFTLDRTGCDSSAHHVLSLSPLRLLDDYVVDPVESGTGERCPPPDASGDGMLAPVPYEYVVIPSVANPELLGDFVGEAWQSVEWAACAAEADAARGIVIWGPKGKPTEARLRVLAVGPRLYVEALLPAISSGAKSWVNDDHLELWLSSDPSSSWYHPLRGMGTQWCLDMDRVATVQYGIGLADGAVHAGFGGPRELPRVRRAERTDAAGTWIRFELELPPEIHLKDGSTITAAPLSRAAVVLSQSDGGRRQKRLVSTARLKVQREVVLSKVLKLACKLDGAALKRIDEPDPPERIRTVLRDYEP